MTRTRGDVGDISEVDWMPLPSSEFGTVTADPLDPNIVYGVGYGAAGGGSGLVKINLTTGQWENVAPNFGADATKYRYSRDAWRQSRSFRSARNLYRLAVPDGVARHGTFLEDHSVPILQRRRASRRFRAARPCQQLRARHRWSRWTRTWRSSCNSGLHASARSCSTPAAQAWTRRFAHPHLP